MRKAPNGGTFRGLCTTCRRVVVCTFPRQAAVPVMDCLEFDGEVRHEAPRPAGLTHGSLLDQEREPGLCGWCDNEATCTFPRNPGGTWFCEEYT